MIHTEYTKFAYSNNEEGRKTRMLEFLTVLEQGIIDEGLYTPEELNMYVYDLKDHKGIIFANIAINNMGLKESYDLEDCEYLKEKLSEITSASWNYFNEPVYQVAYTLVGIQDKHKVAYSYGFTAISQSLPMSGDYCYVETGAFPMLDPAEVMLDDYDDYESYSSKHSVSRVVSTKSRYTVLSRQSWRCNICAVKLKYKSNSEWQGEVAHIDHIHPFSEHATYKNGAASINELSNLQALCPTCNMSKGKKRIH